MAIYDAMQFVKPDVQTYCIGMAMSMGALLLAGGAAGKRFVLPNSKVMIHQGSGGFRGTPADIQIAAREILSLTRRYAEVIAHHSGRDVEQVMRDIDRDRFLGAGGGRRVRARRLGPRLAERRRPRAERGVGRLPGDAVAEDLVDPRERLRVELDARRRRRCPRPARAGSRR